MSYEIKYEGAAAELEAINDVKSWLGAKRFEYLVDGLNLLEDTEENRRQARFALSFAGVQGFPVEAMCNRYMVRSAQPQEV